MQNKTRLLILTCLLAATLTAFADGGQRNHEQGTKWVDPVEYFELQDIDRTDFQRDYDQGDIDFNKVIKQKGKKIYGLRLKPFAGAMRVEKFLNIGYDDFISGSLDYQDLYGIQGIPLHEAAFCIYVDEGVSRNYSFTYHYTITDNFDGKPYTDKGTGEATISITGLHLVPSEGGVGLSYALSANVTEREQTSGGMSGSGTLRGKLTKPSGVDGRLGRFIYFNGGRDLLVMLGGTAKEVADKATLEDLTADEKEKMTNHPWPRIYFLVEEIMVEDDEEAIIPLSSEDKEELAFYLDDLMAWIKGEADPLGLGERTDAKTAAVINVIATVSAALAGGTLAAFVGGTGAQIASNMTESIINADGGDFPPPDVPEQTEIKGVEPKREEEEEEKPKPDDEPEGGEGGEPPVEDDPTVFKSTLYPELCEKYVKTDPFGDIYVKDPVTLEDVPYTNNGDGTWRNLITGQDWTPDEIGDRLRYRDENADLLLKDAMQGQQNKYEQHTAWVEKCKRDAERKYSDEMLEYRKEVAKNDAELEAFLRISELATRYGTVALGDGSNVNDVLAERKEKLLAEQKKETKNAEKQMKYEKTLERFENVCNVTDKVCDTVLYTMGKCVPGGLYAYDAYALSKGVLVAASEVAAQDIFTDRKMGLGETYWHLQGGALKGIVSVVQNHAGGIAAKATGATTGALYYATEFAVFSAPESVTSVINANNKAWEEGRKLTAGEVVGAAWEGFRKKTAAYVTNKAIAGGLGYLGKVLPKTGLNETRMSMFGKEFENSKVSSFETFGKLRGSGLDKKLTELVNINGIKGFTDAKGSATFFTKTSAYMGYQKPIENAMDCVVDKMGEAAKVLIGAGYRK